MNHLHNVLFERSASVIEVVAVSDIHITAPKKADVIAQIAKIDNAFAQQLPLLPMHSFTFGDKYFSHCLQEEDLLLCIPLNCKSPKTELTTLLSGVANKLVRQEVFTDFKGMKGKMAVSGYFALEE